MITNSNFPKRLEIRTTADMDRMKRVMEASDSPFILAGMNLGNTAPRISYGITNSTGLFTLTAPSFDIPRREPYLNARSKMGFGPARSVVEGVLASAVHAPDLGRALSMFNTKLDGI